MNAFSKRAQVSGADWDATLDSIIAICPNIAEVYQEKATSYIFHGDYTRGFEYVNRAVELDSLRWLRYRGYLNCIFTKNYEHALKDFAKAQQIAPKAHEMDHTNSYYMSLCYMQMGSLEIAEQQFLRDIAQQKKGDSSNDAHYNSLFYLAVVYYEMKLFDLAEKYFKECLQLYEQYPEANFYLAKVYQITGNSRATDYFLRAKEFYVEGYRMTEPHVEHVSFLVKILKVFDRQSRA